MKKNLQQKKWHFRTWRTLVCLTLSVCLLLSAAGCGKEEPDDLGTELMIYYVKDHPYFGTALGSFISSHKRYEIKLTPFETDAELCSQLATEIAAGTGPDVVLLTSLSELDIYKAAKGGNLADLSSYFEEDTEFSRDNYYAPVLDSGNISGKQYIVPFTFSMESMIVNQTLLEQSGVDFNSLQNFYDIVNMFQTAYETADEEHMAISLSSANGLFNDGTKRWLVNSGIPLIDEDGNVSDQIDQAQTASDFLAMAQKEYDQKSALIQQLAERAQAGEENIFPMSILCMSYNQCYIYDALFAEYYSENIPTGDTYLSLPWRNINGQIQPIVNSYGFVNQTSKSKRAAYELMRYLMDYKDLPQSSSQPLSVNKSIVSGQLDKAQGLEMNMGGMQLNKMSSETRAEIEAAFDEMATAIIYNTGYYDIVCKQMIALFESGNLDGTLDTEALQDELTRYVRE